MNLNSVPYIQQFLAAAQGGQIHNGAAAYGVQIQETQAPDGELYWRVIGVHHLLQAENEGNHTILVEALDEEGNRLRQGKVFAATTWDGNNGAPPVKALDKASHDPMGADFPMGVHSTNSVWIKGAQADSNEPSDRVVNMHTRHDDEPPGNTFGHHSFYVVFQRTRKGPSVVDPHAMLTAARTLREQQMAGNSPFAVYARQHNLGAPVTPEFTAGGYRARGFEGAVVFAPLTEPDSLARVAW